MKIELLHVVNGYRKFHLGFYDDMHQAIKALKNHVYAYSAISEPRFRKSMSGIAFALIMALRLATTCCKLERSANATWIIW